MKQNFSFIYKLLLVAGDALALTMAFTIAYILRVSLDNRPIAVPVSALTYIAICIALLPLWIAAFAVLGLYRKRIYDSRPKELFRLLVGSITGVVLFVTFDFFSNETIFPAKLIPIYVAFFAFILLWLVRSLLRNIRLYMFSRNYGITKVMLVGNNQATYFLSRYLYNNPSSGFRVVAILANKRYIYEELRDVQVKSLSGALEKNEPHALIQTDSEDTTKVYTFAIDNHLDYQFVPSHSALFTAKHSVELLGAFPIINVHTTPLIGWGRAVKRVLDVISSVLGLLVSLPISLGIAILMKIGNPRASIVFKQTRLSRFNRPIYIYKFRTQDPKYDGTTPEEAFTQMGKPELIKKYRDNGDHLDNDPRLIRFGNFLRKTSLDELPQLINVLKGDISLVGPRALVPFELENYEYKSLILSVKSGLTGLAQISGRRDISFEERRKIDMYYVQNWSIWLDFQIILRTIFSVITGRGAK